MTEFVGLPVRCDRCGCDTYAATPYRRKPPMRAVDAISETGPLPRVAAELMGAEIPWGEHPDDNAYGLACSRCVDTIRAAVKVA